MQRQPVIFDAVGLVIGQQPRLFGLAMHQPQVELQPRLPYKRLEATLALHFQIAIDSTLEPVATIVTPSLKQDMQRGALGFQIGPQPRQLRRCDVAFKLLATRQRNGSLGVLRNRHGDALGAADDRVAPTQCKAFLNMPAAVSDAPLILASTSRYRAELLARLGIAFEQRAPGVEEDELAGEPPVQRAIRLAHAKAQTVALQQPGRWVLGSDQVGACGARLLHKPGGRAAAFEQLQALAGQEVQFHTAVALVNTAAKQALQALDLTTVRVRSLTAAEIGRYLDAEPAFDCAGSFKIEGLGIRLMDEVISRDPSGLIGLPLIAVRRLLAEAGLPLP